MEPTNGLTEEGIEEYLEWKQRNLKYLKAEFVNRYFKGFEDYCMKMYIEEGLE